MYLSKYFSDINKTNKPSQMLSVINRGLLYMEVNEYYANIEYLPWYSFFKTAKYLLESSEPIEKVHKLSQIALDNLKEQGIEI